jgi:putative hemolysin
VNGHPIPKSLAEEDLAGAHIVDVLITERAKRLRDRKRVWQAVRRWLFPMLRYGEAMRMADRLRDLGGEEIFEHMAEDMALDLAVSGVEHVPAEGPVLLVGNHPTGIVDGFAVWRAIRARRPDLCYFANRDALRVAPRLIDVLIPVEWVEEKRSVQKTREMTRRMVQAFRDEAAVVMFPSGKLAKMTPRGLRERAWLPSTVHILRRHKLPVVPMRIEARNSWLYYFFSVVSPELRDMTLFHEMLNKKGARFSVEFGPPIPHEAIEGGEDEAIARLQAYVEDAMPQGVSWEAYAAGQTK